MGVIKLPRAPRGHEDHGHAAVSGTTRDHARVGPWVVPALGHGDHGKLQALGGVDRHHADRREPTTCKGCRRDLGCTEPYVVLGGGASRSKSQLGREVTDVADGGEDVGLAGAPVAALALEAFEPPGVTHHLETDVCHGPPPHG